jgi:rhodanese-related sulfurtransferase
MKELNRTDRLTIASLLVTAILIVGLATLKQPEVQYRHTINETVNMLESSGNFISPVEVKNALIIDDESLILVDIRSPVDYQKSHIVPAINIPMQEILEKQHLKNFSDLSKKNKTIVLYGKNQTEANGAWLILKQAGFDNVLVMEGGYQYYSSMGKEIIISAAYQSNNAEKPAYNFKAVLDSLGAPISSQTATNPEPVKVIKKEKKSSAEGGC